MEVLQGAEVATVVAEDELEVEDALDRGRDAVEDDDLSPGWEGRQQWHHPAPMQDDGDNLVPAALQAVRVYQDLSPAAEHDHGDEGNVLNLNERILEPSFEQREEEHILRPDRLPHLGVDEPLGDVHGVGHTVVDDVLVLPPVCAHTEEHRTEEQTPCPVFLVGPEYLAMHELVHDEATLLPEEGKEYSP